MTHQQQEELANSATAVEINGIEPEDAGSSDEQEAESSNSVRDPEKLFPERQYDQEPCYYSMNGKDRECRGIVYRTRADGDLKGFMAHDGVLYKTGDHVYLDLAPNEPYTIASITSFKYAKRDHVVMKMVRFYRVDEIPEISLALMQQERNDMNIVPNISPESCSRELFSSDTNISHPVSSLRGRIFAKYVSNVATVGRFGDFALDNNNFFWSLAYNADSSRLAAIQNKIRVGNTYQAVLPPDEWKSEDEADDEREVVVERDQLVYQPDNVTREVEQLYVRLARSYRCMTMLGVEMLDSQKSARVGDLLYNDAITQLHQSGYNVQKALEAIAANDYLLAGDVDFMTQDDAKKFTKGIKTYGKNFTRIQRELLPHHSREQLVSYYYLWKKTPEATKPKVVTNRARNQAASIKRASKNEKLKISRPASAEYLDYDSATESDVENEGSSARACHNCFGVESRDWHHANGQLMCTQCRLHYKKYGQSRAVPDRPATVPACLFKRTSSCEEEESGVRTRAHKKEKKSHRESMSEQPVSERRERKSPSILNGIKEEEGTPVKRSNGKRINGKRQNGHLTNGDASELKKPKLEIDETLDDEKKSVTLSIGAHSNGVLNNDEKQPKQDDNCSDMSDDKEIKEEVEEDKPSTTSGSTSSMSCTTTSSSNPASSAANTSDHSELSAGGGSLDQNEVSSTVPELVHSTDIEEDSDVEMDSPADTWSVGDENVYESQNAIFVRAIKRSCGHRCSRSDYVYKFKEGGKWDLGKRHKEQLAKERAAAASANPANPSTSAAQQVPPFQGAPGQNPALAKNDPMRGPGFNMGGHVPFPPGAISLEQMYMMYQQQMVAQQQQHQQQQQQQHQQIHQQQQQAAMEQQREMEKRMMAFRQQQQQQQQAAVAAAAQRSNWENLAALNNQMTMFQQIFGPGIPPNELQQAMLLQQAQAHQAHAAAQAHAQAQAQAQAQAAQREREQREREQREKEAREQQAREQQAREQHAREQQQQAAAAAIMSQISHFPPEMQMQYMLLMGQQAGQQPNLPPGFPLQAFQQNPQAAAAAAGIMNSDMMRRLQADAVMRPHQQ